jgi:N-acetylglucosaminyldiphosphoundecaprenol N-acetyl-beta-D-mannosaminyltransferase
MKIRPKRYPKVERKYAFILGIKLSITTKNQLLRDIELRLDSKERFYVITPNPENVLIATKDWLMKKVVDRCDFSIPDGIGLAQAYKFLSFKDNPKDPFRFFKILYQGLLVGYKTIFDKKYLTDDLPIIKGRELFYDVLKIADDRKLRVYFFGGENGENQKAIDMLVSQFPNIIFKTNHQFPIYNKHCKPVTLSDRKLHKAVKGSIKMFEPDLIFVALNSPKQEKWIYRNLYRTKAICGFALGGTFNYAAGNMKLPPKWVEKIGFEWLYRLMQEPKRFRRILNAFPIFPFKVFVAKLFRQKF